MKGPFTLKATITDGGKKEFASYTFTLDKQEDVVAVQKAVSDAMNSLGLTMAKGK